MSNEKFKVKFGLAVGDTVATIDGTTGNISTDGSATIDQNLDVLGATTLGNAAGDTVTINGDTLVNNALTIGSSSGDTLTVNSQVAGNITFTDNSTTTNRGITGAVGANDYWKYGGGAVGSDQGYAEIATGDNGTEPIYARQYNGGSISKEVKILDGSGNTALAGNLTLGGNGYIYSATDLALELTGAAARVAGDLTVSGGDLITGNATSTLFNTTATTLNIGGAATTVSIGANTGTTTINNSLVADDISIATVDTTNLEVTNIKAKDGTAAMVIADSTGIITVSTQLNVDNINISGNTISSTDTNGNINLTPNGTGKVVSGTSIIGDDSYVLGQMYFTRNTSYVPPVSPLTTVTGTNGIVVSSSAGGAAGYNAGVTMRYHIGDTTAGAFSAAALTQSAASGTNMAPSGISTNAVLGTTNYDGYTTGTSNNYANQIASANQGGGINAITPLQAQAYARQGFTNSTTVTTSVTGASGTGTVATLTFTTQNTSPYAVGQSVTIAGMTPSGYNGTYTITAVSTSSISYANTTTGFTSGGTIAAANTVTAAGSGFRIRGFANNTPMTTGNRFNFMDLTASAATFKADAYTFANSVITGSTLTATNYMTLSATTGTINQDSILLKNTAGTTTYGVLNSTSASFNGDAINLRNTAGTTTYANFNANSASITANGPTTIQRIATAGGANPSLLLTRQNTSTATPVDNDGTGLRISTLGTSGTNYGIGFFNYLYQTPGSGSDHEFVLALAKGDQTGTVVDSVTTISSKPTNTRIFAGTAGAAGSTAVKLTVDTNKITAAVPVAFPVYTAAQANALTGAVGWQICISDSAGGGNPNGMMAFWDTTNARWSYIHDNSAV